MYYTSIRYKENKIDVLLPETLISEAKKESNHLYGAWDDDGIHVLFLTSSDEEHSRRCIIYVYYDDIASQEIVGELIAYILKVSKKAGQTQLDVQVSDTSTRLEQLQKWFEVCDFDVVFNDRRYLIYDLAQMRKTTFFEKTSQARQLLDKVVFYNQLTKSQLMEFATKMESISRERDMSYLTWYLVVTMLMVMRLKVFWILER